MLLRIVFLLLSYWPLHAHAEWYYIDLLSDKPAQIVLSNDSVGSHSREAAVTCPKKSAYFCIRSSTFAFAVPKKFAAEKQWTVNDVSYRVTAKRELFVLGKEDNLVLIEEVKEDGAGLRFLYSLQRGLIGLWHPKAERPSFFVLQNACGFAAPPACKEVK